METKQSHSGSEHGHSVHVLARSHLITLVVQVAELRLRSKVKGDFLLDVPEKQMPISSGLIWARRLDLEKL